MIATGRGFFFSLVAALLFPILGTAATHEFRVLIDADNNAATGCDVGGLSGVDQIVVTVVRTDGSTGAVERGYRLVCSNGAFGSPVGVIETDWPVGYNEKSGAMVVENRVSFADLGGLRGMRIGFDATSGGAVHSATALGNGNPILFLATSPKRRAVGESDREFHLDGNSSDWGAINPLVNGIASGGSRAIRMHNAFAFANGSDQFVYFRVDANVSSDAPFAEDDEYTRASGEGLSVNAPGVLANDGDPSGQPLTATPVSAAAHGNVTLNSDGSFTYAPNDPASTSTDTFQYKASNGAQESNVAVVTIKVSSISARPPVPGDDAFDAAEDQALNVPAPGVLSNDSDPNGDSLTASLASPPAHGTVTFTQGGGFTYTPDANFFGADSFTYTVSDGTASATATVTIEIAPVNDAPFVQSVSFSVPENSTAGTVVGIVSAGDIEGDTQTFSISAGNDSGAFAIDSNTGEISVADPAPLDFESTPTFNLQVTSTDDGSPSESGIGAVGVDLIDRNDVPQVAGDSVTTDEDTPVGINLVGTDQDGDTLTFEVISEPLHGTLSGSGANLTYTPDPDYNGADAFGFQAVDAESNSIVGTVTIGVNPVNDAPIGNVDVYATVPGSGFTISPSNGVLANDVDPDGDALVAVIIDQPDHGTINFNADGGFSYMPNPAYSGIDSFTYDVVEAGSVAAMSGVLSARIGTHAATTVSINIHATNAAPTANNQNTSVSEDGQVGITLTGADADGDAIQFNIDTPPAHGTLNGGNANVIYKPDDDYHGPDSFTFTTTDGFADSAAATVSITVNPINDAPDSANDLYGTLINTTLNVTALNGVLANDSDIDGPTLTATLQIGPAKGSLSLNPDGSFSYTPNPGFTGTDHFLYKATDGLLLSIQTVVLINVRTTNAAPTATAQTVNTNEDTGVGITLTGTDTDGDALSFSVATGPTHGVLTGSAPNLFYSPNADYNGSDSFTFTASDGFATSTPATVSINIASVNDAPVANDDAATTDEEQAVSGNVLTNDTDIDGGTLTAYLVDDVNNGAMTFNSNGSWSYTPNTNFVGVDTFTYRANDGSNDSNLALVAITVTSVNDTPSFTSGGDVTVLEDSGAYSQAWASSISAGPGDESSQTLTFNVTNNTNPSLFQSGPTIASDGTLSFTPTAQANGSADITVTLSDDGGGSNTSAPQTFTIFVTAVNDEPSFTGGGNVTVGEDSGAYSATWATALNKGQPNESSQTLSFVFTANDNSGLFQAGPAIDGTTGALSFTPALNAFGTANVTVELRDDAGTANGGDDTSASVSFQIIVTAANDAPTVMAGGTRSYTEGGTAVVLEPSLLINDVDSANIQGATVSVSGNLDLGNDVLACPGCAGLGITANYNTATGTLTLTGTTSVANYQAALRTVTFANTSDAPATAVRGIDWFVTDDSGAQSVDDANNDTTVNFTATNDAPANTVPGAQTVNEDTTLTFGGNISISDPDAGGASVQVTLASTNGTMTLSGTTGLSITTGDGTGDASMVFTGTIANINAALNGMTFDPTPNYFGSGSVAITTNDQGNTGAGGALGSGTDTVTINITNVNDVPVLTAGGTLNYTELDPATAIDTTVTVSDIDDTNIESATVQITGNYVNGEDVLSYADVAPITGSFNAATGTLTLTGSDALADYQTALRSVKYNNTSNNPTTTQRTVTFIANDGDGNSAAVTSTINVTSINTAPVLSVANALSYTEGDGAVVVDAAATVSDVDSANLTGATIDLGAGYVSGDDVLSFTPVGSITGSFSAASGTLTLSGTDTLANYQTALRSVTYSSTTNDPEPDTAKQITFTVDDGQANNNFSNSEVVAVTVTPVNDAPVVTAGATLNYTEDDPATVIDNTITVTDPDDENVATTTIASATVSITGNFEVGDQLVFADIAPITGSYNAGAGVLTLSGGDSAADYQAALRTVKFSSTLQDPSGLARTISWKVNDGSVDSNVATSTVNFTPVNDNPAITAGATLAYTENDPATALDASIVITDIDDTDMASATVAITGNFASGEDVLAFADMLGISGAYNSGTGVLTLTGTTTIANWETALESVTYENTSNNPSTASRTITWTITDASSGSDTDTSTVNVTATNDAPALTAGGTLAYTENDPATAIDTGLTLTDPDDTQLNGATVSITANFASSEDVLAFSDQNGIAGSYNSGTGVLTLSGASSVANYLAALESVTYQNTSNNPSTAARTITWTVNDGDVNNSGTITSTVNITATNDAPVLTAGATLAYTEGDGAVAIDNTITVNDIDDTNIEGATATITGNFQSGADVLAFATIGPISGSYNAGTGVLTLTGSDTLANYQAALRTVTFNNTSDDPSTASRTITWTITDGTSGNGGTITSTVNLTASNDGPSITAPANDSTNEDVDRIFSGANGNQILIADADAGSSSVEVILTATNGTLSTNGTAGLTFSAGNGADDATMTFTGTISDINTALNGLTYKPATDYSGAATIDIDVDDQGFTGTGGAQTASHTINLTINNVNDAPVLSVTGALAFNEGDPAANLLTSATITDVDDTNIESATIQISGNYSNGEDVLSYVDVAPISGAFNAATGTLTLTGSDAIADYITALQSVKYSNTSDNPSTAQRTVTWTVNDGGTNNAGTITSTIDITPTNDTPTMTAGGTLNYAESDPASNIDTTLTVTDPDSNITGATVTISANYLSSEDVLSFATIGAISGSFNSGTGVLTLTGTDTVANYQAALRTVKYQNTSESPSTAARTISWVVTDASAASSVAVTSTVNVSNVNDAPVVTAGATLAYTENDPATVIDNTVTVTDVDSPNATGATVSISANFQSGADVLSFATIGLISGSYNAGTGVLTLTGTDSMANYQAALRTVKYHNTSEGPTAAARTISWIVTDGVTPSSAATSTINITPTNDPPVLSAGNLVYAEGTGAFALDSAMTLTDVDSANITGATVAITGNYVNGEDILAFATIGPISGSFNAGTGVLTLTGTDTVGNYQTALRTVTYDNSSDNPTIAQRTVTWTATDGTDSGNDTSTLDVTATNDAPTITAGATITFTEGDPAKVIDNGIVTNDVDDTNLETATVSISANFQSGADVLAFATIGPISGSYNAGTGVLTLTGSDTVANYQAALRTVTFENTSQTPSTLARTISWRVNDGTDNSLLATSTVNVVAVNDAPVVVAGGTLTYTENDPATSIDNAITINDVDSANLTGATVSITAGLSAAEDVLSYATALGISGTYNSGTGVLTLTGTATVANYETALRNVKYSNTSEDPSTAARTITWVVNDGGAENNLSSGVTSTVNVVSVNDAPTLVAEAFQVIGNTELRVDNGTATTPHTTEATGGSAPYLGVLVNDSDVEGDPFAVTGIVGCADNVEPFDCTVSGASVSMYANGRFSYTPAPGATSGSFQYTATDTPTVGSAASTNQTVSFTASEMVWYIKQGASGNGTSNSPFGNFATIAAGDGSDPDDADDYIFVHYNTTTAVTVTGTVTLEAGQRVWGEGYGLSIPVGINGDSSPTVLVPAGSTPSLTRASGDMFSIGNNMPRELRGLNMATTTTGDIIAVNPSGTLTGSSTLTITGNTFSNAGNEVLDFNMSGTAGAMTLTMESNTWDNTGTFGGAGIDISRSAGGILSINLNNNSNIEAVGNGIVISGGAVASTFVNSFADNSIHGDSTGGVTVSNATFDSVSGGGVTNVDANTLYIGSSGNAVGGSGLVVTTVAGSLSFDDLDIYSGGASTWGIRAAGSGTFSIIANTGSNVVNHTGGTTAIEVATAGINLVLSDLESTAVTGVDFNTVTGTFSAPSGSNIVASGAGPAFKIASSSVNSTYAGNFNVTAGSGISLSSVGGTVIFSGTTKTFSTGGSTAVSISGTNTGIFTFSNGGLTISRSTGGAGISASGGGTLIITKDSGSANIINSNTSGTGVALSVDGVTIGTGGLVFQSIGQNGGANGIFLNNTGTTAGLSVTGTGTLGSGGTIQNTTGDGVRLSITDNVNLDGLTITNAASGTTNSANCHFENASGCESAIDISNSSDIVLDQITIDHNDGGQVGISADGVTNLAVTNSTIYEVGNADAESAVILENAAGDVSFTDVVIDDPTEYGIRVYQTSATLDLTLTRVTVQNNLAKTFGEQGFSIRGTGTSVSRVLVDDCDFLNTDGIGVDGQTIDSAQLHLTVQNTTFSENRALPMAVNFVTDNTSTGYVKIHNNQVTDPATAANGSVAFDLDANRTSTLHATITNNTINGTGIGTAIEFLVGDGSNGRAEVRDNNITVNSDEIGMTFQTRPEGFDPATNGRIDVILEGNTINNVTNPSSGFIPGVQLLAGSSTTAGTGTLCAHSIISGGAGNNVINGTNSALTPKFEIRQRVNNSFFLQGFTGTGSSGPSVASYFDSNNSGTAGATFVATSGGTNPIQVNYQAGTCNTPTTPTLPF